MQKIIHKGLYTVWFHLCEILKLSKLICNDKIRMSVASGRLSSRVMKMFYAYWGYD